MTSFETPAAALKHFGVLGMKWGHHKAVPTGGGSSAPAKKKKITSQDIHAARDRQRARLAKIQSLDHDVVLATSAKGKAQAARMLDKIGGEWATGPDAKIAAKSTRGEKWLMGTGWALLGGSVLLSVASAAAGGRR